MACVIDNLFPHLLEELVFIKGVITAQPIIVGRCRELWNEAVPEVVYTVTIAWEEVFTAVVLHGPVVGFVLGPA